MTFAMRSRGKSGIDDERKPDYRVSVVFFRSSGVALLLVSLSPNVNAESEGDPTVSGGSGTTGTGSETKSCREDLGPTNKGAVSGELGRFLMLLGAHNQTGFVSDGGDNEFVANVGAAATLGARMGCGNFALTGRVAGGTFLGNDAKFHMGVSALPGFTWGPRQGNDFGFLLAGGGVAIPAGDLYDAGSAPHPQFTLMGGRSFKGFLVAGTAVVGLTQGVTYALFGVELGYSGLR